MTFDPKEIWFSRKLFDDPWWVFDVLLLPRPEGVIARRREVRTTAGQIDLLIGWPRNLAVVEVKREYADERAIAQVLAYVGALQNATDIVGCGSSITIWPVVAARGFTNRARLAAAASDVHLGEMFTDGDGLDVLRFDSDLWPASPPVLSPAFRNIVMESPTWNTSSPAAAVHDSGSTERDRRGVSHA